MGWGATVLGRHPRADRPHRDTASALLGVRSRTSLAAMTPKQPPMEHVTLRLRIKAAAQAERRSEGGWMRKALEDQVEQRLTAEAEAAA